MSNPDKWQHLDWEALDRLRDIFLHGVGGDYWRNRGDLEAYDLTFGQRIGWKWEFVLRELVRRGWSPPEGVVMDFACGSGIASRTYLRQFAASCRTLALYDRSELPLNFAMEKAREEFPSLAVEPRRLEPQGADIMLVSHVINELTPRQLDDLVELCSRATAVLWVEPGTHQDSRQLIDVRERLRSSFNVVAPCTHQQVCGMLAAGCERHWCHHFAPSPGVHTDGNWVKFGQIAGIDLRSLPLSFMVLDKRPLPPLPTGSLRIIGRPRMYKAYALLFGCDESGVRDRRLMKRHLPDEFRELKRDHYETLQAWRFDGDDVVEVIG
jgi:hypothetical protein